MLAMTEMTPRPHRHERQRQVVVARQHRELRAAGEDDLRHLVERARGLLDADDAGTVLHQADEGIGLHVDGGPAGDVVDEDRDVHGLRDGAEVAVEPLLGRLVVVRVDHERAGGPAFRAWAVRSMASPSSWSRCPR
jgi:hypothetical protein